MLVFLILLGIYSIFFIIALIHLNIYISNVFFICAFQKFRAPDCVQSALDTELVP